MKYNFERTNKKISFNYEFIETYVAGIVLNGSEIVSIKKGNIDISEAYCCFVGNELFLRNAVITSNNSDGYIGKSKNDSPNRDRKLLLNKYELKKIKEYVKTKGLTVVPYKITINERHFCKIVIVVAKGKKNYDKKITIKERDIDRQVKLEI
jgi:SsrA-binding protein